MTACDQLNTHEAMRETSFTGILLENCLRQVQGFVNGLDVGFSRRDDDDDDKEMVMYATVHYAQGLERLRLAVTPHHRHYVMFL